MLASPRLITKCRAFAGGVIRSDAGLWASTVEAMPR